MNFSGESTGGNFSRWVGMSKILADGWNSPIHPPQAGKTLTYDSIHQICNDFAADIMGSCQHFCSNTRGTSCFAIPHISQGYQYVTGVKIAVRHQIFPTDSIKLLISYVDKFSKMSDNKQKKSLKKDEKGLKKSLE